MKNAKYWKFLLNLSIIKYFNRSKIPIKIIDLYILKIMIPLLKLFIVVGKAVAKPFVS